jgi:hypothetical protein
MVIFQNAERRNNAAERLLAHQPPILSIAALTTIDQVKTNPLGPIWIRPRDYRDAISGTAYDAAVFPSHTSIYRRCPERDAWIDKTSKHHALIEPIIGEQS